MSPQIALCFHVVVFLVSFTEHMIRLTSDDENEIQRNTGMVQIFHDNRWSPICAKGWGRNETNVVCKQLGFVEGSAKPVKDDLLKDSYWMTNVTCKGNENRIDACTYNGFVYNACPDYKYVQIICS